MSSPTIAVAVNAGARYAVPAQPAELFPESVQDMFARLQAIANDDTLYENGETRPTQANVDWAVKVLLRVLPRHYLMGADLDTFRGEIHVSWEHENKRVVAYLPAPGQLKVYYERVTGNAVEHKLQTSNNPWEISGILRWLYE